jgi:hypothetical protein
LRGDRLVVGSSALLRDKFFAEGNVLLRESQIGSALDCSDATFHGPLDASGATIKGRLLWTDIHEPERASLLLADAMVNTLADEKIVGQPQKI